MVTGGIIAATVLAIVAWIEALIANARISALVKVLGLKEKIEWRKPCEPK